MELEDLEIYKLAREISLIGWSIYNTLSHEEKKIFGDQFIRAIDSIGANIAEGFGRFHYLDKNKLNYNARGSLFESIHWVQVMKERSKISETHYTPLTDKLVPLKKKLNSYIASTKNKPKTSNLLLITLY